MNLSSNRVVNIWSLLIIFLANALNASDVVETPEVISPSGADDTSDIIGLHETLDAFHTDNIMPGVVNSSDTANVADVTDTSVESYVPDVSNTPGGMDESDAAEASEIVDVSETAKISEASDTLDEPQSLDSSDVVDDFDIADGSEATEASDAIIIPYIINKHGVVERVSNASDESYNLDFSDVVDSSDNAATSDFVDASNGMDASDDAETSEILGASVTDNNLDVVNVPEIVSIIPDSVDAPDTSNVSEVPDTLSESYNPDVSGAVDGSDSAYELDDITDASDAIVIPHIVNEDGIVVEKAFDASDESHGLNLSDTVDNPDNTDMSNVVDTSDGVDESDAAMSENASTELDTFDIPGTFDEPGDKELSLQQARALALTSNLDIQSQMEAYWATSDTVKAETWIYEPEFQVTARQQITNRDNNASQEQSTNRNFLDQEESLYNARLQNILPTGGTIALDYRLIDRVNNQGGISGFGGLAIDGEDFRQFETFVGVTFTQPLLRKENIENLGEQNPQNPRVRIQMAKKTSDIAFQQVRRGLSTTISQVEVAYWNLYSALEEKRLREESLEVAKDIYEDNRERFRLGKMAKLELLQSESEIAEREANLEEAVKRLHNARNELNTYFSESLVCADFSFIPVDEPQIVPIAQSCEEIMAESLFNHPEYLIRKEQAELEGLKLAYAKNQRLPQLDLTLSYGYNGLGLTANGAWQQLEDQTHADWLAGVQLSIPLFGDRKAYRQMSAAKRRKQQALMNLKSVEIQILNLVITTYKKLKSNFNVYQKASQVVSFREELLEAEIAKLEEGKSSTRLVFEIESDLSDSKIARLAKMVEYQKTQIELLLFQGTFLEARNVDISEDQLLN